MKKQIPAMSQHDLDTAAGLAAVAAGTVALTSIVSVGALSSGPIGWYALLVNGGAIALADAGAYYTIRDYMYKKSLPICCPKD